MSVSRTRSRQSTPSLAARVERRVPPPVDDVVHRLRDEDVLLCSAGLAFYALVSIAPLTVLALWLTSLIVGDHEIERAGTELARFLPDKLGIEHALRRVADLGTRVGFWAVVTSLWPATAYGAGLRRAFDRLAGATGERAKGMKGRGLAMGLILVLPAFVMGGLGISLVASHLLGDHGPARVAGYLVALVVGFGVAWLVAALIYKLFSAQPLEWPAIAKGALTAAASISVLSVAYGAYLAVGTNFDQRYLTSGLAAVVLLAVWLFLANGLLLVGYQVAVGGNRRS